jgi:hypothetical protein
VSEIADGWLDEVIALARFLIGHDLLNALVVEPTPCIFYTPFAQWHFHGDMVWAATFVTPF